MTLRVSHFPTLIKHFGNSQVMRNEIRAATSRCWGHGGARRQTAFGKHGEGLSRTCVFDLQSAQVKMSVRVSVPENKPTFFLRDSAFKKWA